MQTFGKEGKMNVEKIAVPLDKQAEEEYAAALAADTKAVQDYNVMMGNLEDPNPEEEEGDLL